MELEPVAQLGAEITGANFLDRTSHHEIELLVEFDGEIAAFHLHGDVTVD